MLRNVNVESRLNIFFFSDLVSTMYILNQVGFRVRPTVEPCVSQVTFLIVRAEPIFLDTHTW